jgi:hypothetical protein
LAGWSLEPKQADLLTRICAGPLLTAEDLRDAGALPSLEGSSATPVLADSG